MHALVTRAPLHQRVRAVSLLVATTALATAAGAPRESARPDAARDRLGTSIARATGLHVDALVFERAGALQWRDAVMGCTVLFTAAERPGAPRDIWRARVRVTPGARLLSLRGPVNLTVSPLGDDGPLVAEPVPDGVMRRVAFVTRAFGVVQSAAVLAPEAEAPRRLTAGVSNAQSTLSWRGVARWDVRLDAPVAELTPRFDGGALTLRTSGRSWRVRVERGEITPAAGSTLVRQEEVDKAFVHWAVDTVRAVPWVGPAPIAWLEERVFHARDLARQWRYRWLGGASQTSTARASAEAVVESGRVITAAPRDEGDPTWPPPDIEAPLARSLGRERNEGVWTDATPPWLRRTSGAPAAFVRTSLRLDAERPYTRIVLLAMDMRQLRLAMQAGVEDPVPLVGPRGDGRIPRDPAVLGRVVGAFNGAFKTEHGEYGMVVDRRVLLPPHRRSATVATLDDGRVAMGSWAESPALPSPVVSLRQNLDPLVADGVENPTRRGLWGFVLGGIEHMPTVRSGLCMRDDGALMYVWGEETTARLLGRAMRLAGCSYGMHLDMNPGHAMFHFLRVDDLRARRWQYASLASGMHSSGERFLYHSPKDFFYLTLRDHTPAGLPWEPVATQPAPRWSPAIVTATSGPVTLTSIALDRVRLSLRAGRREPVPAATVEGRDTLHLPAGASVLGAIELGVATSAQQPRGLTVDGRTLLPFVTRVRPACLDVTDGASIRAELLSDARDALQGALLVDAGRALPVDDVAEVERAALGVTADGRLVLAQGTCGADVLQAALVEAGVTRAMALVTAGGARAHWGTGVLDAYPTTTLFVLSREAPSPVTRLETLFPAAPVPAR